MTVETFEFIGSSNLSKATYDKDSEDLTIEFQDGNRYLYRNVPPAVYRSLTLAESAGSYFRRNIRDRYFTDQV